MCNDSTDKCDLDIIISIRGRIQVSAFIFPEGSLTIYAYITLDKKVLLFFWEFTSNSAERGALNNLQEWKYDDPND